MEMLGSLTCCKVTGWPLGHVHAVAPEEFGAVCHDLHGPSLAVGGASGPKFVRVPSCVHVDRFGFAGEGAATALEAALGLLRVVSSTIGPPNGPLRPTAWLASGKVRRFCD